MDCESVKEKLFAFLDGEVGDGELQALETHFERCLPCYKHMVLERALGKVIRARARGWEVPPGLENRLRGEIRRRAMNRGRPHIMERPLVWLAAVAALFTVVGLTAALTNSRRPAQAGAVAAGARGAGEAVTILGEVVCVGCEWQKREHGHGHEHRNGIRSQDGRIWNILETEGTRTLIHNPAVWGRKVRVRGTIFESALTLEVDRLDWI